MISYLVYHDKLPGISWKVIPYILKSYPVYHEKLPPYIIISYPVYHDDKLSGISW